MGQLGCILTESAAFFGAEFDPVRVARRPLSLMRVLLLAPLEPSLLLPSSTAGGVDAAMTAELSACDRLGVPRVEFISDSTSDIRALSQSMATVPPCEYTFVRVSYWNVNVNDSDCVEECVDDDKR